MFKKIKIGIKITALVVSVTILSLLIIAFITDLLNRKSVEERYYETINVIADLKVEKFKLFTDQIVKDLELAKELPALKNSTYSDLEKRSNTQLDSTLNAIKNAHKYTNIYIVQLNGKVIYKANESDDYESVGEQFADPDGNTVTKGEKEVYFSTIFKVKSDYQMFIASPITLADGDAILVYNLNMNNLSKSIQDTTSLGHTGEVILGRLTNDKITYLTPLRNDTSSLKKVYNLGEKLNLPMQEATTGKSGFGKHLDYRNKDVLIAWRNIPVLNWGVVVKIDESEALNTSISLRYKIFGAGLVILILSALGSVIFSNILVRPLISLKSALNLLGKGNLPQQLNSSSNDEIGEMTYTLNNLVTGLKGTATFAQRIGEGDFESEFKPLSENDTLGLALLQMRDNLKEASNKDDEQNWVITGLAEVGDILRSTNSLDDLSERVLAYVVKRIGALQGAFYIINDEDKKNISIEMHASYAYNKKKYLQGKFKFAEGLIGQAVAEQDTLLRMEIPDKYLTITSGLLGDRKPKCLLIVPLITIVGSEKEAFGVMEFAGFEKFSSGNIRFVNEVSEIIARTIFNIKVNETTRKLLEMSQKQSEELQQQQEILRQNAEEMQATQEELKRTNSELEYQIEEVNNTQKRMQILLENASEVIIIYEKDTSIRYVSPSSDKILGYSTQEMINMGLSSRISEESQSQVEELFRNALKYPDRQQIMELLFERKDGDKIWVEAVLSNQINDKAVNGIIANIRNITERRLAEQEARRRGQMQALSENSPDLITRFNTSGQVFYINPVIETYTGISKDLFLQKSLSEMTLNPNIVTQWENVLKKVVADNHKVATEMDFPSVMGDRVMQVNAIPEYAQDQSIESVLVVSHDITDRKIAELEIQVKNKKITESINYAQRIQGSILPNNFVIQQIFPQSFILYKPRDVVSGDFPWFLQKGDDLFIAAVDCTGHGVPGALISLIGYFLLNNIVRDFEEPGIILDELDKSVTLTLRQDAEDATTRDGMDIALCKINMKTKTLQYAGAHRPLYFMHENELIEIKGDKYPIGGGQYKARGHFTTNTLTFNEGDAVYFCSDGFPDQFGGPDNRKFSSRRIRDLVSENPKVDMQKMYTIFDTAFEDWKNGYKQTDDVLMIGIKF